MVINCLQLTIPCAHIFHVGDLHRVRSLCTELVLIGPRLCCKLGYTQKFFMIKGLVDLLQVKIKFRLKFSNLG